MKIDTTLMADARDSWRKFYEDADITARRDDYSDVIYEAFLAGFCAGRPSPPRTPLVLAPVALEAAVLELESVSYDLFAKVSSRMGLFRMDRTKTEIRELQARLDKLKNAILESHIPAGSE